MNKKLLIRVLVCVMAVSLLLCACNNTPDETTTERPTIDPSGPTSIGGDPNGYAVSFTDTPAVTVSSSVDGGSRVEAGTVVTFTLTISSLYEGTPVVRVGEETLTPNAKGEYSYVINGDTVFEIEGLTLRTSSMSGSGTSDSPFQITDPIDLYYIAEKVNAGDSTYVTGYYSLKNDLDMDGEQLPIIGNGSSDDAVFAGTFYGNGYSIYNYRMEITNSAYVGLFGVLEPDYTTGTGGYVGDLHLKNFTMDISVTDNAYVGALVGYNMGGNLMLCSAENGTINVYADSNSFSYAGGLVGFQQGLDYNSVAYYSSITYCNTDVDVNCNSGLVYAAGGIVGYVSPSREGVTGYLRNCYTNGDVYGALRAGGIAGYIAYNTSVSHCYATGTISAQTTYKDKANSEDFCYAYAGGIVGNAEANSAIAECFSTATLYAAASLGGDYQVTGGVLANAAEPGEFDYGYKPAAVYNCVYVADGVSAGIDMSINYGIARIDANNYLKYTVDNDKLNIYLTYEIEDETADEKDGKIVRKEYTAVATQKVVEGNDEKQTIYVGTFDGLGDFELTITDGNKAKLICDEVELEATLYKGIKFFCEDLNWNPIDWAFEEGKLPVVNLESADSFEFDVVIKVGKEEYTYTLDTFMPLSFWYAYGEAGIPTRLVSEENSNLITGGYYFDEACTQPIPSSYIPVNDLTIYTKLVNYADVAGDYQIMVKNSDEILYLNLATNGLCTYDDAGSTSICGYYYDGENVIFELARFGRFASGELELTDYQTYSFYGTVLEDGSISIVGGVYTDTNNYNQKTALITEEDPLIIRPLKNALADKYGDGEGIYTFYADGTGLYESDAELEVLTYVRNGNSITVEMGGKTYNGTIGENGIVLGEKALHVLDAFAGSWNIESMANKIYTFDGMGNWSYVNKGYKSTYDKASGTYTVDENGVMTLKGKHNGTAKFVDGVLHVTVDGKTTYYYRDGGIRGTWFYTDYNMTLTLKGITADGVGLAWVEYLYDGGIIEAYDLTYALDEQYPERICLYYDSDIFGYMEYEPERYQMNATIYVGSQGTFMSNVYMSAEEDYKGEWIGKIPGMEVLEFNGYGAYTVGVVTINGEEISYLLDDATLSGAFVYNDKTYKIAYNEADTTITLTVDGQSYTYYRRDFLADLTLTDGQGNLFTFDGKTPLGQQGVVYLNGQVAYTYAINGDTVEVYLNGNKIGSVVAGETAYELNLSGQKVELRIVSAFTGTWAMSGSTTPMVIGTLGLDGKLYGVVKEQEVVFTLESDGSLCFEFTSDDSSGTFYVIQVGNGLVVDSSKEWYLYNQQVYCAPMDELFGTWKDTMFNSGYQFDGMSNSEHTSGLAQSGTFDKNNEIPEDGNAIYYYYSYNEKMGTYILWTVDSTTKETLIYRLNFCSVNEFGAFVNEDGVKAFTVEKGNRLYNMEVTDETTDITYFFDGFGKVTTSDGAEGTYTMLGDIDYTNGIARAKIVIDGESYNAEIDFSNASNTTITLEKV